MSLQKTIQARLGVLAPLFAMISLIALGGCKGMTDAPFGSTVTVEPFGSPVILNPVSTPTATAATTKTQQYRVSVADAEGRPLNNIDVNFLGQFSNGISIDFGGAVGNAPPVGSGTISVTKQTDDFGFLLFQVTAPYYDTSKVLNSPYNQAAAGSATGGTLAEGTYYYTVTALDFAGETNAQAPIPVLVTSGTSTPTTTGSVTVSWQAVPGATSYRIYRGPTAGTARLVATLLNPSGDPVTFLDIGYTMTTTAPPAANTTGLSLNSIIGTAQATSGSAVASFDISF